MARESQYWRAAITRQCCKIHHQHRNLANSVLDRRDNTFTPERPHGTLDCRRPAHSTDQYLISDIEYRSDRKMCDLALKGGMRNSQDCDIAWLIRVGTMTRNDQSFV